METVEEANGNSESMHVIAKGKRTKRQRVLFLSAPPPTVAASSSTSSAEFSASTAEEEEDMANCLILLAQGRARDPEPQSPMQEGCNASVGTEKFTSRRIAEATTTKSKAGFYVYECKTCNKCFPSFQALGGHRASHKKPKMVNPISVAPERKDMEDDDGLRISLNSFSKPIMSLAINNSYSKPKVHECSICGAEFSSGQALGGHMRRHRPLSLPEPPEAKKERNILSLDLNLPAPSDDDHGEFPRSPFVGKQPLLLSATALVDCHY